MKQLWAIACVVGYAAFWTFGFLVIAGLFGDRDGHPMNYVLCLVGLGLGTYARGRVLAATPKMHGKRAAARARLEEDYKQSTG
jgi:hypothetical protein